MLIHCVHLIESRKEAAGTRQASLLGMGQAPEMEASFPAHSFGPCFNPTRKVLGFNINDYLLNSHASQRSLLRSLRATLSSYVPT